VIREYIEILQEERRAKNKDYAEDGVKILEALAATGLRSVRYLKEIEKIEKLSTNDWDPAAVELIKKNMEFNNIDESKYDGKYIILNPT
jgi:tRNA G26 N,N-dimethylase Trm1